MSTSTWKRTSDRSCGSFGLFLLNSFVFLFIKVITCSQPNILKIREGTGLPSYHLEVTTVSILLYASYVFSVWMPLTLHVCIYVYILVCMYVCICLCLHTCMCYVYLCTYQVCCWFIHQTKFYRHMFINTCIYNYIIFIAFHLGLYFCIVFHTLQVP